MPMPFGNLTSDDYQLAIFRLFPRGAAWRRDTTSFFGATVGAIADLVSVFHNDVVRLFDVEADPTQTQQMLGEWLSAFGIKRRGTEDAQRLQLAAVISDPGGFTSEHYVTIAGSLGIVITTECTTAFEWTVHAPSDLTDDDQSDLEAAINLHNRATCVVTFSYDDTSGARLDFSSADNFTLGIISGAI